MTLLLTIALLWTGSVFLAWLFFRGAEQASNPRKSDREQNR